MSKGDKASSKSSTLVLNIEGRTFSTTERTAKSIHGSLLSSLNKESEYYDVDTDAYCFDRDSSLFPHILAAHRDSEVHVPQDVCAIRFRKELEFWKIPKSFISPCCWNYFYGIYEDLTTLNKIIDTLPKENKLKLNSTLDKIVGIKKARKDCEEIITQTDSNANETSWRQRLWLFLDEPRSSKAAMGWLLIFLSVATVSIILNIIWLEESVRVEPYLAKYRITLTELQIKQKQRNSTLNDKVVRLLYTDPHIVLLGLDCFCTIFFVLEVCAHFALCPNKRRYFSDWFQTTKTLLAACMLFTIIFEFRKDWLTNDSVAVVWFLIKSMNTLRVVLLTKIKKISSTANVLNLAFLKCQKELGILLFVLFLSMILYGGLIFAFEMDTDMFPDTITSMWWALITMTTIGYGDFHPTKSLGYLVGLLCAIDGLIMVALPIVVIASYFSRFKDRNDDIQRHMQAIKEDEEEEVVQGQQEDELNESIDKYK